jgi:hypothetical protein
MKLRILSFICLLLLILAACSSPVPDSDATTPATSVPDATADDQPTPANSAAVSGQPSAVVFGRTDDGVFFHGAADAPVTLIDYADFL